MMDGQRMKHNDGSVKLMIGGSVYLCDDEGNDLAWPVYMNLYQNVYLLHSDCLAEDGILLVLQTNAYRDGKVYNRYRKLARLLEHNYDIIDEKVWQRRKADFFQVPFSHVFICRPSSHKKPTRKTLNKNPEYFRGIWKYPHPKGGAHNAYPEGLCRMIVETFTKPGDRIVDPFAGTGKILAVAAELGRKAVGYEIDHEMIPILKQNGIRVEK